ncbi:hypothetical protein U9M48_001202 [Paspalum notatum var. saurae]|uniref:SWIM-type domain-containing protein n=1 Tax=Paspalum notatum var. saurae TaxID=547442 RepID=A0AAQ3PNW8_PASNO
MDPKISFNLECRIFATKSRFPWFLHTEVVDSDTMNYKDLLDEIMRKYPCSYGEVVKMYYYCAESKSNIEVCCDQDLVNMFQKNASIKTCHISIAHYDPSTNPPAIPLWDVTYAKAVEIPCTSSMPAPTQSSDEPSQQPEDDDKYLQNPEPENEYVGVDEEGMYIDLGPQAQGNVDQEDDYVPETDSDLDSNSESDGSDDEMVEDNAPPHTAEVVYDKVDPPMEVGSIYPNMNVFRLALATHTIKNEFEIDIEHSEPGRYRAYCCGRIEGCKWRIHASTMGDNKTVKVKKNPHLHECHSTRRKGQVKGATKHWVADIVRDWLVDNPRLTPKALQQRIKDEFKVWVHYKRVYHGKELAMTQLYGDWRESFDNLYRFKKQIEESCPGSLVVIDHHTINKKIRFNRLFFAMKPCIDGFLQGCRPYLAIDSTFLTGKFRGQLCVACAVDGHNWMYPVAFGVIDSETSENWSWYMEKLKEAIGTPLGLTISTDCGQAIMGVVSEVFPTAEHRECTWHLVQNFKKRYTGKVFDDHLWAASYSWNTYMFEKHYKAMAEAKPEAVEYLQESHTKLWTRSQFSTLSKVDYVTNNLAEVTNKWVKAEKAKHLDDLLDSIRQKILIKWNQRRKIARQMDGKILDHITKKLREQTRNLDIDVITSNDNVAEVVARGGSSFRFVVNLDERTCSCRAWQVSSIPCKHAIAFITSIRNEKLEDHVDHYFSVEKFRAAYEGTIPAIPDKSMWPKADHGFFMHPPLLKSTAGRRKETRYKGYSEGGRGNKGRHQCPICHEYGHHWYTCKDGDPADIAAMLADRGLPKRKKKQVIPASTVTSIVPVSAPRMVFPDLGLTPPVRKKRKSSSTTPKAAKKKKSSTTSVRSGQGSNQPDHMPLSIMMPSVEVADKEENQEAQKQVAGHVKKNNRKPDVIGTPAMGTRSKSDL